MKVEHPSRDIKQWHKKATNLDRHWKESRKEEKRLSERRKIENQISRANILANAGEAKI